MGSNLRIPRFENGEFLSEAELYQLAWLPFELYRLSNVAKGHAGFFHPEAAPEAPWNRFDHEVDALTIQNLFVISAQGVPFLVTRPTRLDLSEVTIDRTTLYASAYFAGNSRALKDEHFVATLVSDSGEAEEEFDIRLFDDFDAAGSQRAERAPNAYQVLFHWGEESAPEIEGTRRFQLELGRLGGPDGSEFRLCPTAYYPVSLPALAEAADAFREQLAVYTELLLDPALAPRVERSTLLDRLELLDRSFEGANTPTHQIIADVRSVVTAAAGFFLRSAYAQNPKHPDYQNLGGLRGRILEHQLQRLFRSGRDDLSELIAGFAAFPTHTPETGQAQIEFFRNLQLLFDAERTEAALGAVQAPPEQRTGRETRRTPQPVEPKWLDIDKKGEEGD